MVVREHEEVVLGAWLQALDGARAEQTGALLVARKASGGVLLDFAPAIVHRRRETHDCVNVGSSMH